MDSDVIQTLWIGAELKPLHTACLNSFLIRGHKVDLYCYERVGGVPKGVNFKDASEILPSQSVFAYQKGPGKGSFSAFSNIFRYALLFERGGIWADTDIFCLKPFSFESRSYVFSSETLTSESERIVASCFIKTPPQTPLMRYCLDESLTKDKNLLEWGEIGPQLLHRAVSHFQLENFIVPTWSFCALGWDEPELILDPDSIWSPPEQSIGLHLNHEILRRAQADSTPEILEKLRKWGA